MHRAAVAIAPLAFDPVAGRFDWAGARTARPLTLVVLDADYSELVRVDDIGPSPWRVPPQVAEMLSRGAIYHALLLAVQEHDIAKSPLTTFVWR